MWSPLNTFISIILVLKCPKNLNRFVNGAGVVDICNLLTITKNTYNLPLLVIIYHVFIIYETIFF